jgi:Class III cytochrome C family
MKGRWPWIVISANLAVIIGLIFAYPHLMVSPGALAKGHAELATDCFACHAPLRGAAADRCITCHTVSSIGLTTTKGTVITRTKPTAISFHQELSEQNCMACHSDHAGPKLTHHQRKPFSHDLLRMATRERCDSCHTAPATAVHRNLNMGCTTCHTSQAWKPATFDHASLPPAKRNQCESCHKAPGDALHRQITGNCVLCHRVSAWKPSSFNHDQYFRLDKDHNAACVTCHTDNNFSAYTCYGCHEHTRANVLAKHRKEGINKSLDNCVRCHRSAEGDNEREGEREGQRREKHG